MNLLKKLLLLTLTLFWSHSLHAEIQQISINWASGLCKTECIKSLEREFHQIPGVSNVQINGSAGLANIKLKPGTPFAFQPFNQAMQLSGLSITSIRLSVRGQISDQGQDYILISSGDNTSFTLINPVVPERDNTIIQYGVSKNKLTPAIIKQLEEGKKLNETAIIDGPLLFPERSPPLLLVIEQVRFGTSRK